MTTFTFHIRMRRVEGSLQRFLGMVRRRGYDFVHLEATSTPGGEALDVRATLESDRDAALLARHIKRLVEVEHLALVEDTSPLQLVGE